MINKKSLKIIILGVIFINITTVFYIFSLTESKEEGISVDEGFYGVNQEGNLSIQKIEIPTFSKENELRAMIERKFLLFQLLVQEVQKDEVNINELKKFIDRFHSNLDQKNFIEANKLLDEVLNLFGDRHKDGKDFQLPLEKTIELKSLEAKELFIKEKRTHPDIDSSIVNLMNFALHAASAGDLKKADKLFDVAIKLIKENPKMLTEEQQIKLRKKAMEYYDKLGKSFFNYEINESLDLHDKALEYGPSIVSFKDTMSLLDRALIALENSKKIKLIKYKNIFIGKIIPPKNNGCYIGTWSQESFFLNKSNTVLQNFQSSTGSHVAIDHVVHYLQHWDGTTTNLDSMSKIMPVSPPTMLRLKELISNYTVPALIILPPEANVDIEYKNWWQKIPVGKRITLQDIIDGKLDDYFRYNAELIKELGYSIMLETLNEFDESFAAYSFGKDGKSSFITVCNPNVIENIKKNKKQKLKSLKGNCGKLYDQYGDPKIPDGPERVKDAWKHIHDIFDQSGLTNVTWYNHAIASHGNGILSEVNAFFKAQPWNKMIYYYPGENYIDWVGISSYNLNTDSSLKGDNLFSAISPLYEEIKSSPWENYPIILHEFAQKPALFKSNLPDWIKMNFGTYIPKKFPKVKAFFWIIGNMYFTNQMEKDAFKKYITNNPYYVQYPEFHPDHVAPGKINDLAGEVKNGKIILTWTAPGDDNYERTASYYIVKYRTQPIDNSGGIIKDFRKETWRLWSRYETKDIEGEPKPQKAGTKEQMEISGLKPGKYYFGIQSVDEVPYNSKISNIIEVEIIQNN